MGTETAHPLATRTSLKRGPRRLDQRRVRRLGEIHRARASFATGQQSLPREDHRRSRVAGEGAAVFWRHRSLPFLPEGADALDRGLIVAATILFLAIASGCSHDTEGKRVPTEIQDVVTTIGNQI